MFLSSSRPVLLTLPAHTLYVTTDERVGVREEPQETREFVGGQQRVSTSPAAADLCCTYGSFSCRTGRDDVRDDVRVFIGLILPRADTGEHELRVLVTLLNHTLV